jgi:hypothetical protein
MTMTVTMNTAVRVLYTINSSPQYVLARSHRKVPVVVVQGDPRYGTTSLKACLDAICRSRSVDFHLIFFEILTYDFIYSMSQPRAPTRPLARLFALRPRPARDHLASTVILFLCTLVFPVRILLVAIACTILVTPWHRPASTWRCSRPRPHVQRPRRRRSVRIAEPSPPNVAR